MRRAEELRIRAALMRRAASATNYGDRTVDGDLITLAEKLESEARDEEIRQREPAQFKSPPNSERSGRTDRRRKA